MKAFVQLRQCMQADTATSQAATMRHRRDISKFMLLAAELVPTVSWYMHHDMPVYGLPCYKQTAYPSYRGESCLVLDE